MDQELLILIAFMVINNLKKSLRFRSGMKDLEVMMQNLIMSAFDTVITVEDGVNILEVFMHAAVREVGINILL